MLASTSALMLTLSSAVGAPFDFIRIGDIDGFGFETGTHPCVAELCWPFKSPWPFVQTDLGACSGGVLINGAGAQINFDSAGMLEHGDFLPNLDCNYYGSPGFHANSDEFDNREAAELGGGGYGTYVEVSEAVDIASSGSGWTDVAVSGTGVGWDGCLLAPSTGGYVCGAGEPSVVFDFKVTDGDPSAPIYLNILFADYDLDNWLDGVEVVSSTGTMMTFMLTFDPDGEDGRIQRAMAEIPFSHIFPTWPASMDGFAQVKVRLDDEMLTSYDYIELSASPIFQLGCCCYPDEQGFWSYEMMTKDDCDAASGIYQGDGVECVAGDPAWGACCFTEVGGVETCIDTVDCYCEDIGGDFHDYEACDDDPCGLVDTGCCCYYSTTAVDWVQGQLSSTDCSAAGGMYFGDGSVCGVGDSQTGACCVGGVDCQDEALLCECSDSGGTFYAGQTCADIGDKCAPVTAMGACCYLSGTPLLFVCDEMTEDECLAPTRLLPRWHAGVTCDMPWVCRGVYGACCVGFRCVMTREIACTLASGTWHASTPCSEVSCLEYCLADLNLDGVVNVDDLMLLIGAWGACP